MTHNCHCNNKLGKEDDACAFMHIVSNIASYSSGEYKFFTSDLNFEEVRQSKNDILHMLEAKA